ncbi:uncharacterized protein LOC141598923 [Silene latifolia]|uniref:uncharacterized protein LOC141598923 n=1 Tax=Silene latifolia TaxID=37657 RepID=UPI003D76C90B
MDCKTIMTEFGERFKGKEDVNIVKTETCDGVSAKRKHLLGVRKQGNKWRARIHHPKLKVQVHLGCYSTPEEAALVVKKKKAEFKETFKGEEAAVFAERKTRELYGGKPRSSSECEDDDKVLQETQTEEAAVIADRKSAELQKLYGEKPRGSSECEDDDKVLQETESETEEAAVVADRKRPEVYGGKLGGSGECEDDDGVLQETESEVDGKFGYANEQTSDVKVLAGVKRVRSGKRVARIKDPVSSDANIVQSEACDGVSAKRQQFFGVNKKGKKWQARIRHPKSKFKLHLGYFSTPEEAALVVKKKKEEFKEMLKAEEGLREKRRLHEFEGRKLPSGVTWQRGMFRVRIWHPELKKYVSFGQYSTCDEAVVVADRKRAELQEMHGGEKVAGKLEFSDEQTSDVKVPASVRRVRSGKSVARVKHPGSRARIWLGTYDTAEEAIRSYDKNVAVQMGYDGLNNFEIGDKLNCEFVQGSPTSNIEPGMSGDKRVIDKESHRKSSCGLDFDEAVSAGFINEYGQLLGKYRVLDEQLYLGLPDEIVAGSG